MSDIQKPTPEDMVRDPQADMAVCDAATPGPWQSRRSGDHKFYHITGSTDDYFANLDCEVDSDDKDSKVAAANAAFISITREALPAYIRLYVDAERRIAGTDWRTCPECGISWPHPSMTSYLMCPNCRTAKVKADRERLLAACLLWDEGFTDGEQFTPEQFLAWVNRNRKAARDAIAQTKGESQ